MKRYKGIARIYDYWRDLDNIYAVVEWPEEKIEGNKSNLFLIIREYHDYPKDI